MRLLTSVGIVALYVAIKTIAAQKPPHIQSCDEELELQPLENLELVIDTAIDSMMRQEAMDLVLDRFEKFSTEYLRVWRNITDTFIVSPLLEFIDLAGFHYGQELTMKNAVMEGLGLAAEDPEMVKIGLRELIDVMNIYLPIGSLSDEPSIENRGAVLTRLSKLCQPFDRRSPHAGHRKSGLERVSWRWGIGARPSSLRSFHLNADKSIERETVYLRGRFRYGNLSSHDSTVIGFSYWADKSGNDLSMFFLRPNSERGYELLTNSSEKIDVKELVALPVKRVHFNLPTFKVESNFTVNDWAPQFFGSENPFKPDGANPLKIASSKFSFKDFSRFLSSYVVEWIEATSETPRRHPKIRKPGSPSLEPAINFRLDRPFVFILAATGKINIKVSTLVFSGSVHKLGNARPDARAREKFHPSFKNDDIC